jgi:hypothetical protein
MAPRRGKQPEPQWQVVSIRKRGRLLGIVRAKDAQAAVEVWVERYDVKDPAEFRRLAAYPLSVN